MMLYRTGFHLVKRPVKTKELVKISVRPLAWHDLPTLFRYRRRVLCTDSALALTRGSPLGLLAVLAHLDPSRGVYTGVLPARVGDSTLFGQMIYTPGSRSAHVSFLLPADDLNQPDLTLLLENLAVQAGGWGANHLLAEVEESGQTLDAIRRAGFSVYAWQRIWKFTSPIETRRVGLWQPATSLDEIPLRNLYQSLVPPLVQAAEPFTAQPVQRLVYRQEDELLAYTEVIYGPEGIYLQPVIHPAVASAEELLFSLVAQQPSLPSRPVYLAARSYQAWLEPALSRLAGEVAPRQALMVKHLVVMQRTPLLSPRRSVLEKYNPEASVPLVQNSTIHKN